MSEVARRARPKLPEIVPHLDSSATEVDLSCTWPGSHEDRSTSVGKQVGRLDALMTTRSAGHRSRLSRIGLREHAHKTLVEQIVG